MGEPVKCPYLLVKREELSKVKLQYREDIKKDAEKCITSECPFFKSCKCHKEFGGPIEVKIGPGGYHVPEFMLA